MVFKNTKKFIFLFVDNEIVGFYEKDPDIICVNIKHRRKGYGTALFNARDNKDIPWVITCDGKAFCEGLNIKYKYHETAITNAQDYFNKIIDYAKEQQHV